MGGAKKKSISQMEKEQVRQDQQVQEKKKGKAGKDAQEKQGRGVQLPSLDQFASAVAKMRAITPYGLANAFNLRLSVAKDVLEELTKKGMIREVSGNSRLRVYAPTAATTVQPAQAEATAA